MTTKLFRLSCEDQPGLLPRVLQQFARPGYILHTFSQSRTDVPDIILISLEVVIPGAMADPLVQRLHRIIGVLAVSVSFGAIPYTAVYRLLPDAFGPALCRLLGQYDAQIVTTRVEGHLLIRQYGREQEIHRLFGQLDGPALIAFTKLPLPVGQPLDWTALDNS